MEKNYLDIVNKRKQIEIANIKKCNEYTSEYGLVLSDNQISSLLKRRKESLIETAELDEIYLMLENKDKVEIDNIINEVYKEICNELILDNEELQIYIKKNLSSLVEIITNAVKQNTLDKVFITQKFMI